MSSDDAQRLIDRVAQYSSCVVAYSGGVDSAVVASAAHRAGCSPAIAVTAFSPSVSGEQLEVAKRVAAEMGIRHVIVSTKEVQRLEYRENNVRRCFYCKETLYQTIADLALSQGIQTILSGTNADDLGDYRPGIQAGQLAGVVAPLAQLGLTKVNVRQIAQQWGLSIAARPAQPCLASRIAYGISVTPRRLKRIESAEAFLRDHGFSPLRVRIVGTDQARIEVAKDEIGRLADDDFWNATQARFLALGFVSVEIDPRGFRSGSMNELVQLGPSG